MENVNLKRIYSLLFDLVIANMIGIMVFSLFNLERDVQVGTKMLFGLNVNYGYSFQIIFLLVYFMLFDFFNEGRTFGKLIFSIKVVDKISLSELSLLSRLKRTCLKLITIMFLPISMIVFLIKDGLTLQDKIINTTTISK